MEIIKQFICLKIHTMNVPHILVFIILKPLHWSIYIHLKIGMGLVIRIQLTYRFLYLLCKYIFQGFKKYSHLILLGSTKLLRVCSFLDSCYVSFLFPYLSRKMKALGSSRDVSLKTGRQMRRRKAGICIASSNSFHVRFSTNTGFL